MIVFICFAFTNAEVESYFGDIIITQNGILPIGTIRMSPDYYADSDELTDAAMWFHADTNIGNSKLINLGVLIDRDALPEGATIKFYNDTNVSYSSSLTASEIKTFEFLTSNNEDLVYVYPSQDIKNYIFNKIIKESNISYNYFVGATSDWAIGAVNTTIKFQFLRALFVEISCVYVNDNGDSISLANKYVQTKNSNSSNWDYTDFGEVYKYWIDGTEQYDIQEQNTPDYVTENNQTYEIFLYKWEGICNDYKMLCSNIIPKGETFLRSVFRKKKLIKFNEESFLIKDPWAISQGYYQPNLWIDYYQQNEYNVFTNTHFDENSSEMPYYEIATKPFSVNSDSSYSVFSKWISNTPDSNKSWFEHPNTCSTKVDFVENDSISTEYFNNIVLSDCYLHYIDDQLYINIEDKKVFATQSNIVKWDSLNVYPQNAITLGEEHLLYGFPIKFNQSNITISPSFNSINTIQNNKLSIGGNGSVINSLAIPPGANISFASGFQILLEGSLTLDGSSSEITLSGAGKESSFDSSAVRPPMPASSFIKIKSNSAQLDIDNVEFENMPCAIRTINESSPSSLSISDSKFDNCNVAIQINKINDCDFYITNTTFENSDNAIIFDKEMYNADQESIIEFSFCTFSDIDDYAVFALQEVSTNPSSTIKILSFNNTFYNVGTSFYNGDLAGVTEGRYHIFCNNNIFYNTYSITGVNYDPNDLNESNNLFYNSTSSNFTHSSNIIGDPVFTDAINGDFSLQLSSPAIDCGTGIFSDNTDYFTDEDGTEPDIGAYLYSFPGLAGKRSGTIIIDKDTTIASGYTCTLTSGSTVKFDAGCKLTVDGTLEADNVTFEANATTTSRTYWDRIYGTNGSDIDLRNCTIQNADWGVISYSGTTYLDNCEFNYCDGASYLHTPPSGSVVKNCTYDDNNLGLKILYNTNYISVENNTFINNDNWAIYLYRSNTNLTSNTINNNEDGVYSWRSNGTYTDNTITNSDDDGLLFSQYASVDMNAEWDVEKSKPTNNVITGHGDDGIIVTASAAPDLGTATTIIPCELIKAGFNTIDNNGGMDVYRTSTAASSVNAEGNDWGTSYNVSSNVYVTPTKANINPMGMYKSIASSETGIESPLTPGLKLEADSLFTDAIDFYEGYLDIEANSNVSIQAVVRIINCYFNLGTDNQNLMSNLNDLYTEYGNTYAGNTAKHYNAGLLMCEKQYSNALQNNEDIINAYAENNDQEMTASAYLDGIIFCETIPDDKINSLHKSTIYEKKEYYITTLIDNFPNSNATQLLMDLFKEDISDDSMPKSFKIHSCYPNPFNPITNLRFDLPEVCDLTIKIYNTNGTLAKKILQNSFPPGYHEIPINISSLSSGVYI